MIKLSYCLQQYHCLKGNLFFVVQMRHLISHVVIVKIKWNILTCLGQGMCVIWCQERRFINCAHSPIIQVIDCNLFYLIVTIAVASTL